MKLEEIHSKDVWESFIKKYGSDCLFQSWSWGEVIKKQIGKENKQYIWRVGVTQKDSLKLIAQIVKVVAKRGTFLHVRHGPVFNNPSHDTFSRLLTYLRHLAHLEHASFIRINPLLYNQDVNHSFFVQYGFRDAPIHRLDGEVCWVLDLDKDEDTLLMGMRKTTRYLIKQAQKLGVVITKSSKVSDIAEFMRLYKETANRHKFVQHKGIKEEFIEFLKDDKIILFNGFYKGRLLSSALIIFYNNQAIYHHSASIEQKIPVNYLLQWEVIKEAKRRGMQKYNLWGVSPENRQNHPWYGHSLFKRGFGGREIEYLHALDLPLSIRYLPSFFVETLRKYRKKY